MTFKTCAKIRPPALGLQTVEVFVDNLLKSYNHYPTYVPHIHKKHRL